MTNKKRTGKWSEYSDEEVLVMLKNEIARLGLKSPSRTDIQYKYDRENMPSPNYYRTRFGSWKNALNLAGIEYKSQERDIPKRYNSRWQELSEKEILRIVFNEINDKEITNSKDYAERRNRRTTPSLPTLIKTVGSWEYIKRRYEEEHDMGIDTFKELFKGK